MQGFIESKTLKIIVLTLAGVIIVLLSFTAGVGVGLRKARFSYHFGENYEKNFLEPHPMRMKFQNPPINGPKDFEGRGFRNAHGLAGTVISISENTLIIKDREEKENSISISEKTIIKYGRETIEKTAVENGDEIVVIGEPQDDGKIAADLIRIFKKNQS